MIFFYFRCIIISETVFFALKGIKMQPYLAKKMPIEYSIDKELLNLTAEANIKYGQYKSSINTLELDANYFLDSLILNESFKSTQIEGTQISQDEMFYLKYLDKTDDNKEIQNLKGAMKYAEGKICDGINHDLVCEMHRILLDSVRGAEKAPGQIRTTQNWIGPRGCDIDGATFVPPKPEEVYGLLQNLYEYMNNIFIDPLLINVALSHAQFETIHAYKDGNGRLGRALIPVQMAYLDEAQPILFMSEILELYKPSYQRNLMELRKGNVTGYLKFFLQCVIDQCSGYLYRIEKVKRIFKEDMEAVDTIKGNSIYKIMPIIKRQVVITKKELSDLSGVSVNVTSKLVDKLVELNILVKDSSVMKKGYRYQRIYETFVEAR